MSREEAPALQAFISCQADERRRTRKADGQGLRRQARVLSMSRQDGTEKDMEALAEIERVGWDGRLTGFIVIKLGESDVGLRLLT